MPASVIAFLRSGFPSHFITYNDMRYSRVKCRGDILNSEFQSFRVSVVLKGWDTLHCAVLLICARCRQGRCCGPESRSCADALVTVINAEREAVSGDKSNTACHPGADLTDEAAVQTSPYRGNLSHEYLIGRWRKIREGCTSLGDKDQEYFMSELSRVTRVSLGSRDTTKMLSYYYSTEYLGRILVLVLF